MSMVMEKPFRFANRVTVDGVKGTVIESNDMEFTVQFVHGKVSIPWDELQENPERVKHDR